ncbi:MAG TPA: AraC family transcriptional regulator [Chitinophaga sp.]|uniref:AraC family transcriptional regulator n=1 Tax=Chitinophaga sp. TaxID=1869181 RepID=UPI002C6D80ED|nr:AraC family transcriptional regulator [Chitinophaga sp.]HVI48665.1 AraC family transcriptional regulator [Chitinophaga sp.]
MDYQQILPPDYLRDYVRYFWTLESNGADAVPKSFKTIADGCPGLIFQRSDKGLFYQNDKLLSGLFLYGQSTRHANMTSPAAFRTIGVYFYPQGLQSIFGMNADELTDTCVDLEPTAMLQSARLSEQLMDTESLSEQISILSSYLYQQIQRNRSKGDRTALYAVSQIISSNGAVSLRDLQRELSLTERSFERKFKQSIGMSPKLFSRICRFQASLNQMRANQFSKLSDIAFENEYADQSHFIRAFKEFAGFTPNQYQKKSNEIVENFPEITNGIFR